MPLKGFFFPNIFGDAVGHLITEAIREREQQKQKEEEEERERERQRQRQAELLRLRLEEERKKKKKEKKYPVIVIGCGASGIAALSMLAEAGVEAIGFEASHRIGGRICTVDFADNVVDLGAAWCHGEVGNLVYELAGPRDLLGRPTPPGPKDQPDWTVYSDGSLMPHETAQAVVEAINEAVDYCDKNNKESILNFVRNGVRDKKIKTSPAVLPITESFIEWYEREKHLGGQENPNTGKSLQGLVQHKACPGEFWLNWKDKGYKSLLDLLMEKHELNIQYGKEVDNICWVDPTPDPEDPKPKVLVTCSDGTVTKASRVIVTVSLGVLKERYTTMFTPQLPPEKIKAIQNLEFCVLDKIYISFESRWWPEGLSNFRILWRQEDKAKFGPNEKWVTGIFGLKTIESQPKVLLAWLYGNHAKVMEMATTDEVEKGINKLLDIFKLNFDVTPVTGIIRSSWASDRLTRGAYSYRSVNTETADTGAEQLSAPLPPGAPPLLLFAGEAASRQHHSAVHGAVEAGIREAERAIRAV